MDPGNTGNSAPSPLVSLAAPSPQPIPALPTNPAGGTSPGGPGVLGQSNTGVGVRGESIGEGGGVVNGIHLPFSPPAEGVLGHGAMGVHGVSVTGGDGVFGEGRNGVHGRAFLAGSGVWGEHPGRAAGAGVGVGVTGTSVDGDGVVGTGGKNGVHGESASAGDSGVWGENTGAGAGVSGTSQSGSGVFGSSQSGSGVFGSSQSGPAGHFQGRVDVMGDLNATGNITGAKVTCLGGLGVVGGASLVGNVTIQNGGLNCSSDITCAGDIFLTNGNDCAENFDVSACADTPPGTVLAIDDDGTLCPSRRAYDRRVAGVVSGAGEYKPGIVLGRCDATGRRRPVALAGRVYCRVDAGYGTIEVGDLLTTSPTEGQAMKASDPAKAFGAVIGKALRSAKAGQALIPILVALQ